jgi:hypothetical protein
VVGGERQVREPRKDMVRLTKGNDVHAVSALRESTTRSSDGSSGRDNLDIQQEA